MEKERITLRIDKKMYKQIMEYMDKDGIESKTDAIRFIIRSGLKYLNQTEENRLILEKILEESIGAREAQIMHFKRQAQTAEEFYERRAKLDALIKNKSNEFFVTNDVERNLKNGMKIIKD